MATSFSSEDFRNEELLFAGVVTGTLEQYKDLLNSLGDVDVRGVKQRTLLYVAVGLGKVDWVEGLLEKGANPGLRDVEGVSAVELAKGLAEKHPEDEDLQSISKLVHLVMIGRESVAQRGCNTTSTSQDAGIEAMGQETTSDLSRKMSSMCEAINDVQSRMNTPREEITTNRDLINEVQSEMAAINNHAMKEISTNRKAGLAARDMLLSALESSVTSMANRERPVGMTLESSTVPEEVLPSTPRTEEDIRRECVEAMMRNTRILRSDEGKVTKASGLYERLYSEWDETACLLKFLKSHDDVSIVIDFDSRNIAGMRSTFRDHDGVERKGSVYRYFADFEEKKVYLGGGYEDEDWTIACLGGGYDDEDCNISHLACALAQMSVCLAFNNGGRPYAKGDDVTERRMKNAVKEVEEWCRQYKIEDEWWRVDLVISHALRAKTQRGREVSFASAVPSMIARDRSAYLLQRHAPSVLEFFRESVMPALLAKAQV